LIAKKSRRIAFQKQSIFLRESSSDFQHGLPKKSSKDDVQLVSSSREQRVLLRATFDLETG